MTVNLIKETGSWGESPFCNRIKSQVFPYLSPEIRLLMEWLPVNLLNELEEIRLRADAPILLRCSRKDQYLGRDGTVTKDRVDSYICPVETLRKTVIMLCNSSLYAVEEELQKGYLTLPGGHRAGFTGRAVLERGHLKTLKQISSVNIRIARFIPGASAGIMRFLTDGYGLRHTLFISPPRCGKTTILRDVVVSASDGFPGFLPLNIGVVDERSEIAGCRDGIPQMPVGHCTDVLDGCPKAEGMMMLVRSMAPDVIATDEIGRKEDVAAVQEVINAGIKLLATAHGSSITEVMERPGIGEIIKNKFFERYIVLSRRKGPGTIEVIYNRNIEILKKG